MQGTYAFPRVLPAGQNEGLLGWPGPSPLGAQLLLEIMPVKILLSALHQPLAAGAAPGEKTQVLEIPPSWNSASWEPSLQIFRDRDWRKHFNRGTVTTCRMQGPSETLAASPHWGSCRHRLLEPDRTHLLRGVGRLNGQPG